MKIQRSDISRFLWRVRKMWKSNCNGGARTVVFTFTGSSYSIVMAKEGLLLTYLCNRVDTEASEQAFAAPFGLLQKCRSGPGTLDLREIVENGESYIGVKWSDGLGLCERNYAAPDPPEYHLLPDLAWHTIDDRTVRMLRSSETETDREERAHNPRLVIRPIEQRTTAIH